LADDTVEVLEIDTPKKSTSSRFFGRARLPVDPEVSIVPAIAGSQKEAFINENDLKTGGSFRMYQREFFIYDCDVFTRDWYLTHKHVQQVSIPLEAPPPVISPVHMIPPYNGFGSEEDSLNSCMRLQPKAGTNVNRNSAMAGVCLRFTAKMVNASEIDGERDFIVTIHLETNAIEVFEKQERNSGRVPGRFAEKRSYRKPGSKEFYGTPDYQVGHHLVIKGYAFELMEADEFSLKYMETHCALFAHADIEQKVRQAEETGTSLLWSPHERLTWMRARDA